MADLRTMADGRVIFDDWPPIRDAIDAAYAALGRPKVDTIPLGDWNLIGLAIETYEAGRRRQASISRRAEKFLAKRMTTMKPVDQDEFWSPDGKRGNCQQAAVASILGLRLAEVPNFHDCPEGFWDGYHAFLESRGFIDIELPVNHCPDCYYLAYGKSPRGVAHAVVYRDGKLAHDPHFSRAGIAEVEEVHLIVPIEIGTSA